VVALTAESQEARLQLGAILGLAAASMWQFGVGIGRPGSVGGPAGDAGLCLALMAWRAGSGVTRCLLLWMVYLLAGAALTGTAPVWAFLIGCPAWVLSRMFAPAGAGAFLLSTGCLVSLSRCGGKLLLLTSPQAGCELTLSGPDLPASLWAEMAPNLLWLAAFALLLGAWGRRTATPTFGKLGQAGQTLAGGRSPFLGGE
jgi:hypothetical protein